MAQLGARFHGMEEVAGSIPARSTNLSLMSMVARRIFLGYRAEPEQQKGA